MQSSHLSLSLTVRVRPSMPKPHHNLTSESQERRRRAARRAQDLSGHILILQSGVDNFYFTASCVYHKIGRVVNLVIK
jgi:hypothetical protein